MTAMAEEPNEIDEALADDPAAETVGFDATVDDEPVAEAAEPTAEEKLADAEDRLLRMQAELQNVLNRTRREVADERKYGALGVMRDLLPALDNIDRALEAASKAESGAELADGFRLVREQIVTILGQHGCEPIAADPGVEFDPTFHEAILQQPSDDVPSGAITMAAQTGFKLHDRVLRAAQVIVSSGPAGGSTGIPDGALALAGRAHDRFDHEREPKRLDGCPVLRFRVHEAIGGGGQTQLFGGEAADTFPVHGQPRGPGGRDDRPALGLELQERRRVDRFDLRHDEVRLLGLDDRAQGGGVEHVDHVRAVGDLHGRRRGVAVDGDDFDAQALGLDDDLLAQLTCAEQEHPGGTGLERRSDWHHGILSSGGGEYSACRVDGRLPSGSRERYPAPSVSEVPSKMHRLFPLVFVALLAACSPQPSVDVEYERLAERAARVEILRDDFGVPHVYGKTDADAVFGMLYAQAEDDFPRIERNYLWALGRLAEVEGDDALYSDLRARLYMTEADARAAFAAAPEWLKTLCEAWADGLNWYLETHPDAEFRVLGRFEPWMPMYFFEGSIGGDIEQIPVAGIRSFYGEQAAVDPAELAAARDRHAGYENPLGSNGFAIAGSRTRSGDAMLLINPHTSFYFRGEMHVVSEEGLNAYGAVTWGQFFIYQGFNERTGWMHTSTRADFMDDFAVEVVETDEGPKYRHGDALRDFMSWDETIRVRRGDDVVEQTFTLYRTHHGPVTHRLDDRWVATKINWDPARALEQSFIRTKQSGHAGFRAMMDIRTNSSNNTVYADAEGNIAYYHGNFMPRRDPGYDWSQPVDGSDPATDWQGLHTVDETVWLLNPDTGWLQNCNSTPFTAAGPLSPAREAYPTYMAPDLENFRGVRAVQLLENVDDLTLDSLIELAYDPTLIGFEALLGGLIEAWDTHADDHAALAEPIEILRAWDRQVGLDSVAMTLAHFYGMRYRDEGDRPSGLRGMALIEHFGTGSDPAERLRIFTETLAMLDADFGSWRTPWGEVNRFQRLSGAIDLDFDDARPSLPVPMAANTWGALASYRAVRGEDTKKLYGRSGNSFVAVVEFGDRVRAKSLLAGGQSNDPASPHFDDQAQRYADRQFKDVPFYREDVDERAMRRYVPGLSQ